jgi:fumarate reductase flavoprotein subunit
VRKGPFYSLQSFPGAYGSFGGIKINYKTEAVDQDGYPIKGLYAVGTDACDIYGDTYPFILGGNTMAFCLNSGRMAAEYAAEYISTL